MKTELLAFFLALIVASWALSGCAASPDSVIYVEKNIYVDIITDGKVNVDVDYEANADIDADPSFDGTISPPITTTITPGF